MAVPPKRLVELAQIFDPPAEVIAEYCGHPVTVESQASAEAILTLLQRRSCTMEDIAHGLGLNPSETSKSLADLERRGRVLGERHGVERFYRAATLTRGTPSGRDKSDPNPPCPSSL
jgi:predicted Rossmann fold nucleotide-binding protein DprA/Smf involved in DNA uptake